MKPEIYIDAGMAWASGYSCGLNGPNKTNCHFSIFMNPELTRAWDRGKQAGEASRANEVAKPAATRGTKGK